MQIHNSKHSVKGTWESLKLQQKQWSWATNKEVPIWLPYWTHSELPKSRAPLQHIKKGKRVPKTEGPYLTTFCSQHRTGHRGDPHSLLTEQHLSSGLHPRSRSGILGVLEPWEQGWAHGPQTSLAFSANWVQGSDDKPPWPLWPFLPDHENALAGFVVTEGCSHNAHILMSSMWDTDVWMPIAASEQSHCIAGQSQGSNINHKLKFFLIKRK